MRAERGFTLLEVLVALAILALALGAVIKSAGQYLDNLNYLRDKSFAHWVGLNRLSELQLEPVWPEPGRSDGRSRFAERDWYWNLHVSNTADPALRRLDLEVRASPQQPEPLVRLSGFAGAP